VAVALVGFPCIHQPRPISPIAHPVPHGQCSVQSAVYCVLLLLTRCQGGQLFVAEAFALGCCVVVVVSCLGAGLPPRALTSSGSSPYELSLIGRAKKEYEEATGIGAAPLVTGPRASGRSERRRAGVKGREEMRRAIGREWEHWRGDIRKISPEKGTYDTQTVATVHRHRAYSVNHRSILSSNQAAKYIASQLSFSYLAGVGFRWLAWWVEVDGFKTNNCPQSNSNSRPSLTEPVDRGQTRQERTRQDTYWTVCSSMYRTYLG
jgi:hypothetical protein